MSDESPDMPPEPVAVHELKEQIALLSDRVSNIEIQTLHGQWVAEQQKRNDLTSIAAGYMLATLESVRNSGQISLNVVERLDEALAYIRPVLAEIMSLPKDLPGAIQSGHEPPDP